MREVRSLLPGESRDAAAEALDRQLRALPLLGPGVRRLLTTLPAGTELSARPFCEWWMAGGRDLFIPRVNGDGVTMTICHVRDLGHCRRGYRDCPEPDPDYCSPALIEEMDLVVLPGLAFDRQGNRLGQGGGHFDRLLEGRRRGTWLVGVAFDEQVIGTVPTNPAHDQRVDWIATPTRLIECK